MSCNFKPATSQRVLHKIKNIIAPRECEKYITNRNPRNLEKMRIAYKPAGYHLENPGRSFWHKLDLNISGRYVSAEVKHYQNGPVISASTSEWAIKKLLFKTKDTAAFENLGRVLAMRCLQSGITEMMCNVEAVPGSKVEKFINALSENGVSLKEPERFTAAEPWSESRPEKPWETSEENIGANVQIQTPKKKIISTSA